MSFENIARFSEEDDRASKTQIIQSQRNTASAGISHASSTAGLTVRDYHLRTVQVNLDIVSIDKLIEELQIARAHLVSEALLAKLKPQR
jgi:hypothetical protein